MSLLKWKCWQVTVQAFVFGHVGFKIRCLLDIQVEMLSGQMDRESGVQAAAGTERTSPREVATDDSK